MAALRRASIDAAADDPVVRAVAAANGGGAAANGGGAAANGGGAAGGRAAGGFAAARRSAAGAVAAIEAASGAAEMSVASLPAEVCYLVITSFIAYRWLSPLTTPRTASGLGYVT